MPLEALIFDVDGTLAETEEWHRRAFNESFQAAGLSWDWNEDLYRDLLQVTGGKERLAYFIEAYHPNDHEGAIERLLAIHRDKTHRYNGFVKAGNVQAKPGVVRLIREAHQNGVRLAVATTTMPTNVDALIRSMFGKDAEGLIDFVAAGDVVAHKKPAPDIYLYACEHLGVPPSACIAIEDSENGVRAAYDAGLTVVATPSLYLGNDDFSHASSVLSNLGEPEAPYRYIAGALVGKGYVDIAGLRGLLAKMAAQKP
jgi:HAD superfamily hydrolase (TIGR01509 family)